MLSIRQCVESTWLAHMTGKSASKSSFVTLDTFNSTVELKVRADGPAKVLELIEIDSKVEDNQYPLDDSSPEKNVKTDESELDHSNLLTAEYDEQKNKKKKELSILVVVESLSLSIVDKEPAELFYFYFHDIQITAHRKMKELSLVRIIF
jgi:hypothetical protein